MISSEQIVERDLGLHVVPICIMGKAVRRNQRHVNRFFSSELLVKRRDASCDLTILIGVNGVKILGILHLAQIDDAVPSDKQKVYLRPSQFRRGRTLP